MRRPRCPAACMQRSGGRHRGTEVSDEHLIVICRKTLLVFHPRASGIHSGIRHQSHHRPPPGIYGSAHQIHTFALRQILHRNLHLGSGQNRDFNLLLRPFSDRDNIWTILSANPSAIRRCRHGTKGYHSTRFTTVPAFNCPHHSKQSLLHEAYTPVTRSDRNSKRPT
jgi:hypothetical protein